MTKKKPIKQRIAEAYTYGMDYPSLMLLVFPEKEYPRAYRSPRQGGPHGCAMALGKVLREFNAYIDHENGKRVFISERFLEPHRRNPEPD